CHGTDRAGTANAPSLVGVAGRLSAEEMRSAVYDGTGRMPAQSLNMTDVDSVVSYLTSADLGPGGRGGRGAPPLRMFPPGPVVESGPAVARPGANLGRGAGGGGGGGRGHAGVGAYPEGVDGPAERHIINGYGLYENIVKPPFTTLTSYDLN